MAHASSGWSNESSFRAKLAKLSQSQESIQTLSHWVQFHKAHAAAAAALWADEAVSHQDPQRRLLYIYLANDVMQNSRRKATPCVDAFASVLPRVLPLTHAAATASVRTKIERLLGIWEERAVLTQHQIGELRTVGLKFRPIYVSYIYIHRSIDVYRYLSLSIFLSIYLASYR